MNRKLKQIVMATLKRAIVLATVWGVTSSALLTLRASIRIPRIRTLAELNPHPTDRLPSIGAWQAQSDSDFVGPLPSVGGVAWKGSTRSGRLEVSLPDQTWFEPGNARLTAEGHASLKALVQDIRLLPIPSTSVRITVASSTDSRPVVRLRHLYPTNRHLSAARASEAATALESLGLNPSRLSSVGLGSSLGAAFWRTLTVTLEFPPQKGTTVRGQLEMAQR